MNNLNHNFISAADFSSSPFGNITLNIIASIIFAIAVAILANRRRLRLFLEAKIRPNRKIRVSISALLRKKHGNKLLLIKNINRPDSYGPIGGAYKYYNGATGVFRQLEFEPQQGQNKYKALDKDIRGFLPYKNLVKFIKWFEGETDRELDCMQRELQEEPIEINKKDAYDKLKNPKFKIIRKVHDGPYKVHGYDYWQYSIFHIFEFVPDYLESVNAEEILFQEANGCESLIYVTEDDIKKGRAENGLSIGSHCSFLLGASRIGRYDSPYRIIANA